MTNVQTGLINDLESFEYRHHCSEQSGRQDFFRAAIPGGGCGGGFCWRRHGATPTAVTGAEGESAQAGAVAQILHAVPRVRGDVNVEGLARGAT